MDKIILIGVGGHAKSVAEVISHASAPLKIDGLIDLQTPKDKYWDHIDYLGSDETAPDIAGKNVHVSVGMIKNLKIREKIYQFYKLKGAKFPVIISKLAFVSTSADLGEGTIIMHQAFVNADASIGVNCTLNTKSTIEHDVKMGNHCHAGPGATINADCTIGNNVFISSNATINRGVKIGNNCIIGAGSVITKDVENNCVVFGVPGKIQSKTQ
jgi:sugar O-acyltransferase (sialic acid O-acetyltransferase NeuD family)